MSRKGKQAVSFHVIAGLVPAIQGREHGRLLLLDARDKPGHDGNVETQREARVR